MKAKNYILKTLMVSLLLVAGIPSFGQININTQLPSCSNLDSIYLTGVFTGYVPVATGLDVDDGFNCFTVPIGFSFSFYGNSYTTCYIGGNGTISFNSSDSCGYEEWDILDAIPQTVPGNPNCNNQILGCYSDIYTPGGGNASFATIGVAPNRMFVVTFCNVAMFDPGICPNDSITFQMILYETSNNIEVHITNKQVCTAWNGGLAIQGLQDATGTMGITTPGRNATVWTAVHDAQRFTPTSPTVTTGYTVAPIPYAPIPYAYSTIYWYANDSLVATGNTVAFSPSVTTTYTAMAFGCSDTSTATITVPGVHTYDSLNGIIPVTSGFIAQHFYGCNGDTVDFINTSVPTGTGYVSHWNFGDGSPVDSADTNPVHIYTAQGTYSVTMVYTSSGGCIDSTSTVIVVSHQLSPGFYAIPDSLCAGQTASFVNTSIAGLPRYSWNYQDGSVPDTATNPTHIFYAAGNYDVTLTVTDSLGCVATASEYVYVGSINVMTGFHDTSVCLNGASMQLLTTVTKSDSSLFTSYAYSWSPAGNLDNATVTEPVFTGTGDFTYTFTATTTPLGCTSSDTETIHSYAPITITGLTASTTIPYGGSIQLNADGALYYMWLPDNGTLDNPNINDPIATPVDSVTTYTVYGMSLYGCPDSASVTITLGYSTPEFMPSAFSPNNDGLNDYFKVGNMQYSKLVDFSVYNRWGQQVFHTANPEIGWDGTFNGVAQDIGSYNYMVIIANSDGVQKTYTGTVTLIR